MKTNRIRYSAIAEAMTKMERERWDDRISVRKINGFRDHGAKKFGVNWGAIGTTSAEETMKFARNLNEAARIAEMLTNLEIIEEWDAEEAKINDENYDDFVESVKIAMLIEDEETIISLLKA